MNKLQQKILAIAKGVKRGEAPLTRADLAYELRDFGVKGDSPEVARLVWEAYQASGENEVIQRAFVANSGSRSLVDVYRMTFVLDAGDSEGALSLVDSSADEAKMALAELQEDVRGALATETTEAISNLMSLVSGTGGIEKARNEAGAVFEKYSSLVASYGQARERIQNVAADFVAIRNDIEKVYRKNILALMDIFGDSIRTIAPEMFDFGAIKWLDVQGMLNKAELQYTTVSARCTSLMSEISGSFRKSIDKASDAIRVTGGNNAGLILAGLAMFSHYADAATKTSEVKSDIVRMRNDLRHDATTIKADMLRLAKIFKTINDLHVPRARIFFKHAPLILGKELDALLGAFYAASGAEDLRKRRESLLEKCESLSGQIASANDDISYYATHIRECNELLSSMKGQYEEAQGQKPDKPFFLADVFTLGGASRSFNRSLYEWNKVCGPVVKQYNSLREDVALDEREKASLEATTGDDQRRLEGLRRELSDVNGRLRAAVVNDSSVKMQLLAHLKDIVALLRVAKDILESGLDAEDVETVAIEDRGGLALPEKLNRNLELFTKIATDQIRGAGDGIAAELTGIADEAFDKEDEASHGEIAGEDSGQTAEDGDKDVADTGEESENGSSGKLARVRIRKDVSQKICSTTREATEKLAGLFNSWMELQALQAAEHANKKAYERDLNNLKAKFKKEWDAIDKKAEALGDIMARINTAATDEDRKRGLMQLADIGDDWSDDDWDKFLSGEKDLVI